MAERGSRCASPQRAPDRGVLPGPAGAQPDRARVFDRAGNGGPDSELRYRGLRPRTVRGVLDAAARAPGLCGGSRLERQRGAEADRDACDAGSQGGAAPGDVAYALAGARGVARLRSGFGLAFRGRGIATAGAVGAGDRGSHGEPSRGALSGVPGARARGAGAGPFAGAALARRDPRGGGMDGPGRPPGGSAAAGVGPVVRDRPDAEGGTAGDRGDEGGSRCGGGAGRRRRGDGAPGGRRPDGGPGGSGADGAAVARPYRGRAGLGGDRQDDDAPSRLGARGRPPGVGARAGGEGGARPGARVGHERAHPAMVSDALRLGGR